MRRVLLLLSLGIVSLVAATWVGLALAQNQDSASRLGGWKYPGAKQLGSGSGAGGDFMVQATTDSIDKVKAFYGKKVGQKLSPDRTDPPGGMGLYGRDGELSVFQDDSVQPGPKAELRPVVVCIFVQRTKDHYLTLVITRAKGEDQTHISITSFTK